MDASGGSGCNNTSGRTDSADDESAPQQQQQGVSPPTNEHTSAEDTADTHIQPPKLFPGSSVSSVSSELAISSYISRHQLTKQAQEDLFDLLQLHVPEGSSIPSSVFAFRKYSVLNPLSAQHLCYYVCPLCYAALPDKFCDVCPNQSCGKSLEQESLAYFFTISIAEQIKIILKSKHTSVS